MDIKRCDVKECHTDMKVSECKVVEMFGYSYDLCKDCYNVIEEWRRSTLEEGRPSISSISLPPYESLYPPITIKDLADKSIAAGGSISDFTITYDTTDAKDLTWNNTSKVGAVDIDKPVLSNKSKQKKLSLPKSYKGNGFVGATTGK